MTTTVGDPEATRPRHVLQDLGWTVTRTDEGRRGSAVITPHMHVSGTAHLRTSILAAWADIVAGHLAIEVVAPRVPVTLELDVHLFHPAPASGTVDGIGRVIKAGRTVFAAGVDFTTEEGDLFGFSTASFMAAPDERLRIKTPIDLDRPAPAAELRVPFAERAGCKLVEPGVTTLDHSDEVLNASNTINGGLIALIAEEAVLSLSPAGSTLSSLAMRYLQPARVGPVIARAEAQHGLGRVEVRDAGNGDRLCAVATTRAFEAAR